MSGNSCLVFAMYSLFFDLRSELCIIVTITLYQNIKWWVWQNCPHNILIKAAYKTA